jgi:putative ABC transport system permease protein
MAKSIHDSISSLGEDVVYVHKFPWGFERNVAWWDLIKRPMVSEDDYEAMLNKSTRAGAICLQSSANVTLKYRNNVASDISISAVTSDFDKVRSFEISSGRYFSPFEASAGKNVVLLGAEIAHRLFEDVNPVGKSISISGYKATVIGIFKKEGKGGLSDSGMDDRTIIPINFGRSFISTKSRHNDMQLIVKAASGVQVQELSDETTMILRAARRLRPDMPDDFSINRASLISQGFESVFKGINIGGWVIGGFSILVGGFGIANIMFVSVRERTNIIGIQKALGAKRYFILTQFLFESIMLSVFGGMLGLIMILLGTGIVNYFYDLHIYLTLGNIGLAIFISGIIGVIAGYAPAYSAARMDPVEAMGFSF